IDTEGRMKRKFKEQDRHFVSLGCDNIEMDRAVRNVMLDFSGLKKLVKDLSDRFNEYSFHFLVLWLKLCRLERAQEETHLLRRHKLPVRYCHLPRSGPDLVELAGGHFGNRSHDQENVDIDEGDDDGGILSSRGDPKDGI
nr:hypothetical protein [Tanacetum cinerariifolium]